MTWWVFTPTGWRLPDTFRVWRTGAWKTVASVKVCKGGVFKDVYPVVGPAPPSPPSPPAPPTPPTPAALSVSCDPIQVNGRLTGAGTVTTGATTATITGGTAPYAAAWEVASWSENIAPPTVVAPTALTTGFSSTDVPDNDIATATFRLTIQDELGVSAVTQVDATFRRITLA